MITQTTIGFNEEYNPDSFIGYGEGYGYGYAFGYGDGYHFGCGDGDGTGHGIIQFEYGSSMFQINERAVK
jgi:hypothetical protein